MVKTAHASELQLLNHSVGRPAADVVRRHIETCPQCRQRIRELEEERAAFERSIDPERALAQLLARRAVARRRRRLQMWRFAPAGALALALLVWLPLRTSDTNEGGEGARLKGAVAAVHVYVKRGDTVLRADPGFLYQPGEQIRLGVLSPEPMRVTVLTGDVEALRPIARLTDIAVPAGEEILLPGSLILDCDREAERLHLRLVGGSPSGEPLLRTLVLRCGPR